MPIANKQDTMAALSDPRPGMRFTEMCAYNIIVDDRSGNLVVWHDLNSGVPQVCTLENFKERFVYSSKPDTPWLDLVIPEPPHMGDGI